MLTAACVPTESEFNQLSRRVQDCVLDHSVGKIDDLVDVCFA